MYCTTRKDDCRSSLTKRRKVWCGGTYSVRLHPSLFLYLIFFFTSLSSYFCCYCSQVFWHFDIFLCAFFAFFYLKSRFSAYVIYENNTSKNHRLLLLYYDNCFFFLFFTQQTTKYRELIFVLDTTWEKTNRIWLATLPLYGNLLKHF